MIFLITGASHTGKTLLAQRLLERTHFPYLSIDHLKMGLIRSGQTTLTPSDDAQLTDYLWPIVRELIKTAIENRQNLIVEGCYIPFTWRADFSEEDNTLLYGMDLFSRRGKLWQRECEEHVEYAHSPEALKAMLEKSGFEQVEFFSDCPQGDRGRMFISAKNTSIY